ncbi:hypothetical protein [Mycobacteroides abscessus]|uniref:hypothetical protein n=1 Tax=Mycobacteroides abscessus TaxID=36809 RepID=UPI0005E92461|nr:hypothetical protein [Mycobacteroides abscessus]CPS10251.1 Uncharacterised protein [Mycobacteroides abscessus]CPS26413.1 Uncharacterised protein [Mycobacteroides abscessus]CPS28940.1 Uncharacterised protein [Mycobacteroides abscessus]CPT09785.1 Uncharacterised protein [Mycobacteroides abscessus]CPT29374.1 Uncharacterised protein [Mycobacteroides abscessus]
MHSQLIVILEPTDQKHVLVHGADHIAARLLGTKDEKGELALQVSRKGEVTPTVAYQLTEAGASFTLSGTSHRVYNTLHHLYGDDFGPGTEIVLDERNTLVIKSCTTVPQPKPSEAGSKDNANSDAAFNQAIDAAAKLMSLTIQVLQSP